MRNKLRGICLLMIFLGILGAMAGCGEKEAVESAAMEQPEGKEASEEQPAASSASEAQPEAGDKAEAGEPKETKATQEAAQVKEEDAAKAAPEVTQEKIDSMLPVFRSINSILDEEQVQFDAEDPQFYWTIIRNAINDCGPLYGPLYEMKEMSGYLNRIAVKELQDIVFPNIENPPAIPSAYKDWIWYDNNKDAYGIGMSDDGPVTTTITGYEADDEGNVDVYVDFKGWDDYRTLASLVYRLSPNEAADPDKEPVFYYKIEEVVNKSNREVIDKSVRDERERGPERVEFTERIKEAASGKDMGALAAMASYPLTMADGTVHNSAEEFAQVDPESVLTPEFLLMLEEETHPEMPLQYGDLNIIENGDTNITYRYLEDGYYIIGINRDWYEIANELAEEFGK